MYSARTGASAVAGGRSRRRRASLGPLLASDGLCPRRKLFSFVRVLHRPQQRPIVVQSGGHSGVLWSEVFLPDRQRPRVEIFCLCIPLLALVKDCQVVQGVGHVRVFQPESLLLDGERPCVETLCNLVLPLGCMLDSQVVQGEGHIRMFQSESLLLDGERLRVETRCRLVLLLIMIEY